MSEKLSDEKDSNDDIVGVAYDVALDPIRWEELRETWEKAFWDHDFKRNDLPVSSNVVGHFERAEHLLDRLDDMAKPATADVCDQLIEHLALVSALVVGRDQRIAAINSNASIFLGVGKGAKLSSLSIDSADFEGLSNQIASLIKSGGTDQAVYRVRQPNGDGLTIFQMRRHEIHPGEAYVVLIAASIRWRKSLGRILQDVFDLSLAEVEVVRLLVNCASVKDIAAKRGRSIETVRTQIKTILSKTEVRSQVELVRLVMSMMDLAGELNEEDLQTRETCVGIERLKELPIHTTRDTSGRRLDYLVLGDPNGLPVLYLGTELCLVRWPASVEAEAEARGMKIISPIRAGYGNSDETPQGTHFGEQVARDILCIMDHEGIKRLPAITVAADNLFVAHMFRLRPESVSAMIATAGSFPFINQTQASRQHRWHRFVHSSARYTPHLISFISKAGYSMWKRVGTDKMVKTIFASSPADLEIYENPEMREAVIVGARFNHARKHSAHKAFTKQVLSYHDSRLGEPMTFVEKKLPYYSLNGLQDPSMPRETLEENQAMYDWIDFRIYPNAGQWLFFAHWKDVLQLVEAHITES